MTLIRRYWMTVAVVVGLTIAAAVVVFAAQTPRPMYSPPRVKEIIIRPVIDMNGAIVAMPVKVTYCVIDARPSGEVTEVEVGSSEFNLCVNNRTVEIDNEIYDYREIAAVVVAAAMKESSEPLAVTRRTLRSSGRK